MPRVTVAQENFTAGELSQLLDGRFGLQLYYNGLFWQQNYESITQGALKFRNGTRYINETLSNQQARLIPFRYSTDDRYMLEFTNLKMRIYRNGAIVESGGSPVEVTTPYTTADLAGIRFVQIGNVMYLVQRNQKPQKLTRTSHTAWTMANFTPTADPFTGAGDYPGVVAVFEQRMIMGSTTNDPDKLWLSKSADVEDFTIGTAADDAFDRTIFQMEINTLQWLVSTADRLLVGTAGGEVVGTSTNNAGMAPDDANFKPQTYYGSNAVRPLLIDNKVMFVLRDGQTLQSFEYDILTEGFQADNRIIASEHIGAPGFSEIVFTRAKPNIVWAVRNDGVLAGMTYEPKQEVYGWHRHIIAGTFGEGNAVVEAIAALPTDDGPDELWMVVKRTIDGSTVRYVEVKQIDPIIPRLLDYFTGNKDADKTRYLRDMYETQKRLWYLDSALQYDGLQTETLTLSAVTGTGVTATASGASFVSGDVGREIWGVNGGKAVITGYTSSTVVTVDVKSGQDFDTTVIPASEWYLTATEISGLDHLEGEEVRVIADGGNVGEYTVSSGSVTVTSPFSVALAGLVHIGVAATMVLEGASANGPSQTKPKNVAKLNIRMMNTLGIEYGTDPYDMEQIDFRSAQDIVGRPPPLFSGDQVDLTLEDDWTEREKRVYIMQRNSQPATIQLIMPHFEGNDT